MVNGNGLNDKTRKENNKMNKDAQIAYVSQWVSISEANTLIKKLIKAKSYTKEQVRKGPRRFLNGKDKTDGYLTRVVAEAGVCPEAEVAIKGTRVKVDQETKDLLESWKNLLKISNIESISETQIKLNDGRKIKIVTK